ncbi:MAG TPA: hypothetical protein VMU37_08645 [Caulobacteraceae bacterium]|nr:hypothetical protein [Caulobacteraceae bacterium]
MALRGWVTLPGASAAMLLAYVIAGAPSGRAADAPGWDPKAAARYLDGRESEWQAWDRPQKDRGTLCVSCHTQATYAFARPVLRRMLGETEMPVPERLMLASIQKRIKLWPAMQPFYSDISSGAGKEVEAHNAEAVLNAWMLESYDQGAATLSDPARAAFDNAWALQSKDGPDAGSWVWQNFNLAPWEGPESRYHWAALMAVAVGRAPGDYRHDSKIAPNLALLTSYLRSHYEKEVRLNKIVALWASKWFPEVVAPNQREDLLKTLRGLQQPDGGWSDTDLGPWTRRDTSQAKPGSDGYATAIIVLVLQEIGETPASDPSLARGLDWLVTHQDKASGAWVAWSVNKDRDPKSMDGRFMSDAATAYAVLALTEAGR